MKTLITGAAGFIGSHVAEALLADGVPVVGLASGALLLGEPVSALDLVGFALTLAGVALLVRPAGSVESPAAAATPG